MGWAMNWDQGGWLLWLPGTQPRAELWESADAATQQAPDDGYEVVWLETASVIDMTRAVIALGEVGPH